MQPILFVTIADGPNGRVSFLAQKLTSDATIPGNVVAAGIEDLVVNLPNGKVLRPTVWSFRLSDLISFMAGSYESEPLATLAMVGSQAQAPVDPQPVPPPASTETTNAQEDKPKSARKPYGPRGARKKADDAGHQQPDTAATTPNDSNQLVLPGINELPQNTNEGSSSGDADSHANPSDDTSGDSSG
jgi:hypothetical protein